MRSTHLLLGLSLLAASSAAAAPGELADPIAAPGVVVRQERTSCAIVGGLCVQAGLDTKQLPSPAVASTDGGVAIGAAPRYQREADEVREGRWRLEISARLRRSSWAGNVIFVFFDLNDPTAVEEHRYAALYQATMPKVTQLTVGATLSPDEGFQAGHAYRVRVAQLISGKEVVLAEGDVVLE